MRRYVCRFIFAVAAVLLSGATASRAEEARLAIGGYDPVAYFTDGKPVEGLKDFEYLWHNARWRFASAAHRDMFVGDPEHYAPQFNGYCAMGVVGVPEATAHKDTVDPQAWAIIDGKLYLTHTKTVMALWRENAEENIKKAEANWTIVKDQGEPSLVGPPCAAEPPTVIVTTIDDKRRLILGRQIAVDATDKLVGKGDMRAQLQQVGKNVDACLKAAGASEADLVFTRLFVSDRELLAKSADPQSRYLRPDGPSKTTIIGSNFAGPDFLVGVEGIANLK